MRVITPGPTRKNVFKEVARLRSQDADVLLRGGRLLGAVYLLGYSIECYLKFAVCECRGWPTLPEKIRIAGASEDVRLYVHDWALLVEVAGIAPSIHHQHDIGGIYSNLIDRWGPELRYRTAQFSATDGRDLYNDLGSVYQFLKELIP